MNARQKVLVWFGMLLAAFLGTATWGADYEGPCTKDRLRWDGVTDKVWTKGALNALKDALSRPWWIHGWSTDGYEHPPLYYDLPYTGWRRCFEMDVDAVFPRCEKDAEPYVWWGYYTRNTDGSFSLDDYSYPLRHYLGTNNKKMCSEQNTFQGDYNVSFRMPGTRGYLYRDELDMTDEEWFAVTYLKTTVAIVPNGDETQGVLVGPEEPDLPEKVEPTVTKHMSDLINSHRWAYQTRWEGDGWHRAIKVRKEWLGDQPVEINGRVVAMNRDGRQGDSPLWGEGNFHAYPVGLLARLEMPECNGGVITNVTSTAQFEDTWTDPMPNTDGYTAEQLDQWSRAHPVEWIRTGAWSPRDVEWTTDTCDASKSIRFIGTMSLIAYDVPTMLTTGIEQTWRAVVREYLRADGGFHTDVVLENGIHTIATWSVPSDWSDWQE